MIIGAAADWLNARLEVAAGLRRAGRRAARRANAREMAAVARCRACAPGRHEPRKIGHFDDDAEVLEFVGSPRRRRWRPNRHVVSRPFPAHEDRAAGARSRAPRRRRLARQAFDAYREDYAAYYERCRRAHCPPMRDPIPVVLLVPGVGLFTLAADKTTARIAGEFYGNAINVMRGAEAIGGYVGLPEHEAFGIEYWALEDAKLQRMPKPKPLEGRIALITGGAAASAAACAERLLAEGACVVLADLDVAALDGARDGLVEQSGEDRVRAAAWT